MYCPVFCQHLSLQLLKEIELFRLKCENLQYLVTLVFAYIVV
jgi:hypothetical protein